MILLKQIDPVACRPEYSKARLIDQAEDCVQPDHPSKSRFLREFGSNLYQAARRGT